MSNFKMVDADKLDAALTATADALRVKGAEGKIPFNMDSGFSAAVESLPSSGNDTIKGLIERTLTDLTVPDGCTQIGKCAFYFSEQLKSVSLPNSVSVIREQAFDTCGNLETINLDNVESIGAYSFRNCYKLQLDKLPRVPRYSTSVFEGCKLLTNIVIPNSVTYLWSAFMNCTGLTMVTFEAAPTTLDNIIFRGCTNLLTIRVPWSEGEVANAPWGATNATIIYNYTGEENA